MDDNYLEWFLHHYENLVPQYGYSPDLVRERTLKKYGLIKNILLQDGFNQCFRCGNHSGYKELINFISTTEACIVTKQPLFRENRHVYQTNTVNYGNYIRFISDVTSFCGYYVINRFYITEDDVLYINFVKID